MSSNTNQDSSAEKASSNAERQLVALQLREEVYGVDIAFIYTVLVLQNITTVPQTPDYVKGVMNLRGQILPVIDLRVRFGLPADSDSKTRIVIVNVDGLSAGLIVDAVSEVLRLPESSIEPPSLLLSSTAADFITGIGRSVTKQADGEQTERLILLLDVKRLLTGSLAEGDMMSRLQAA